MANDKNRLRGLDFSMLVVFRDLIVLRKTTAVATRLGLSQSAVSHTLSRLRENFGEPLFLRQPDGLQPTQRALDLLPQIETILALANEALAGPHPFEPARETRTFRLAGNDLATGVVAPALVSLLRKEAPSCKVAFTFAVGSNSLNALRTNAIDLAIGRIWTASDEFSVTPLFEEDFAVVMRKDHPLGRQTLTLEDYLGLDHLLVSFSGGFHGMVDEALRRRGLRRRVVASVPMFMAAMTVVAQSDLVATIPSRLAARHAGQLGLLVLKTPLAVESFTFSLTRHVRSKADAGLDWLSEKILEAVRLPTGENQ